MLDAIDKTLAHFTPGNKTIIWGGGKNRHYIQSSVCINESKYLFQKLEK